MQFMNVVAMVQARMGSTRLPGKVLLNLGGRSVLERVVNRLRRCSRLSQVVVATSNLSRDDSIVDECCRIDVGYFRGSELDVLDRFHHAALATNADVVVRITSDCPLIDPEIVDDTIHWFHQKNADYVSNCVPRTFPRGLDVEVFTRSALARCWETAAQSHQREHVTPYFYQHPQMFKLDFFVGNIDYSRYRWTLDTEEDFALLKAIVLSFGNHDDFSWRDVIELMERQPELAQLNSSVSQKALVES